MSDIVCDCPISDIVPNITESTCPESYGQPGKVAFATLGQTFTDATDYDTESSWTTRIAAIDNTKIQVTRTIETFAQEGGNAISFGGNTNETFDGAPILTGKEVTKFTFSFYDMPETIRQELKNYLCQSKSGTLGMYLIGNNWSWCKTDFDSIPISTFFISDPVIGGRTAPNIVNMEITMPSDWDTDLQVFQHVNFNPQNLTNA